MVDDLFKKGGQYNKIYEAIFTFHKKHVSAITPDDFIALSRDMGKFETLFERNLALAVFNEIERQYLG